MRPKATETIGCKYCSYVTRSGGCCPRKSMTYQKSQKSHHPNKSSQEKLPKILEKTDRNEGNKKIMQTQNDYRPKKPTKEAQKKCFTNKPGLMARAEPLIEEGSPPH